MNKRKDTKTEIKPIKHAVRANLLYLLLLLLLLLFTVECDTFCVRSSRARPLFISWPTFPVLSLVYHCVWNTLPGVAYAHYARAFHSRGVL